MTETFTPEFAKALARLRACPELAREIRTVNALPLSLIAKTCGVTTSTAHRWETGKSKIPADERGWLYLELLGLLGTP